MTKPQRQLVVMSLSSALFVALTILTFYWPAPSVGEPEPGRSPGSSGEGGARFVDVTARTGIAFRHDVGAALRDIRDVMSPGVGMADLDGDGLLDLFFPGSGRGEAPESEVYRNLGGMRFERIERAGGAYAGEQAMGCAIADFDLDGDPDIFVTALGPNHLYRNDGDMRFTDITSTAGLAGEGPAGWSTGAAWSDVDGNGYPDLYVARYVQFSDDRIRDAQRLRFDRDEPAAFSPYVFESAPDALYLNNGDGTFSESTAARGLGGDDGKGMSVLACDLTEDGRSDLIVINDVSANRFFVNGADGVFHDAAPVCGLDDLRGGMGVALGDYDGDGLFDLFSTHWQDESNVLYRNLGRSPIDGHPTFEDVTFRTNLAAASIGLTGWGTHLGDFDHDGDVDLFVVNGYTSPSAKHPGSCVGQPMKYFEQARGVFSDASERVGLESMPAGAGRGAAAGDLDRDGDLDLVVTFNNGPARVLENRVVVRGALENGASAGRYLVIRPEPAVMGTVVDIEFGSRVMRRMILSGSSYLSSEPAEAHFGVGGAMTVERVTVRLPGEDAFEFGPVPTNQRIVVRPTAGKERR